MLIEQLIKYKFDCCGINITDVQTDSVIKIAHISSISLSELVNVLIMLTQRKASECNKLFDKLENNLKTKI